MSDSEPKPSVAYANVRDELIAALVALDDGAASQIVPSCPDWSVRDVVAHVCGLNAEKLAGVPGSLGADEATERQVGDRSEMALGEIVDEWQSLSEPISAFMIEQPDAATAFLADLVIHVYDLAEVLNQPTAAAAAATPMSAERYVPLLQERVADRAAVALNVEVTDGATWPSTSDSGDPITLRATSHDFLRSVTGRCTRSQVEALDWSTDPTKILDTAWNQYGTFRAES